MITLMKYVEIMNVAILFLAGIFVF